MPRDGVESHVPRGHREVEVMSPLRVFVHVATEHLRLEVVHVLVEEPDGRVVRVRHGVRGHETLAIALTLCNEAGNFGWRPKVKLDPLVILKGQRQR